MTEKEIFSFYPEEPRLRSLLTLHSGKVCEMALEISGRHPEFHADDRFIREASLLHDIGIADCDAPSIFCHGTEPYIRHGVIGADRLRGAGLPRHALVCERHTGSGLTCREIVSHDMPLPHRDMLPISIEEKIICYADKFYSKSGDPSKRKQLGKVIKSIAKHGRGPLERFMKLHILLGQTR